MTRAGHPDPLILALHPLCLPGVRFRCSRFIISPMGGLLLVLLAVSDWEEEYLDPCEEGQVQAIQHENPFLWAGASFGANCLLWPVGGPAVVGAACLTEPNPPYYAYDKVPKEDWEEFTRCYKDRAKRIRLKGSTLGCLISNALVVGYLVFLSVLY